MPPIPIQEVVEDATAKAFAFASRLVSSARSFMDVHDLMGAVEASSVDQMTFLGMAAVFQIREWERLGLLDHMPFRPVLHQNVCENAADVPAGYSIEHLKSMALLLDVNRYYLDNFTQLSRLKTLDKSANVSSMRSATPSSLWKPGVLSELNPNRLTLATPLPLADTSTIHEAEANKALKHSGTRGSPEGTWSEEEAANYSGYSKSTMKRMRGSGEIPSTLYRQRAEGAKVRYFPEAYKAWFEQRQKK